MTNRFDGTDANGFVRRRNRWAQITTRWLEARERRAFAGAMHADQRLEEESVGQLSRLRAQLANRERLLEGLPNLRFVLFLDPDQHERRISGVERTLRGLYDGAIQTIAVCERACRQEREESEPCCHRYHPCNLADVHRAPPSRALTWNDSSGWQPLRRRSPHREDRQRDACDG
jgi:hypothetical protein